MPPLRQRRDDILLLFDYFAQSYAEAHRRELRPLNVALSDFSKDELATWLKLTTRMIGLIEARPAGLTDAPARKKAARKKAAR